MIFRAIRKEIEKRRNNNKSFKKLEKLLEKNYVSELDKKELPKYIQYKIDKFWNINNNIIKELEKNKNFKIISNILKQRFKDFWIVGGFCRDVIAGKKPKDIDIVIKGDYETLKKLLKKNNIKFKEVGKNYGVVLAEVNGEKFEISVLRADKDNEDFKPGTLKTDFERRDFDINAIYFHVNKKELENKIDKTGIENAEKRIFKFQGYPEHRIKEDPGRVLRVYKMMKKGFKPTNKTLSTARRFFSYMLKNMNHDRLRNDFEDLIFDNVEKENK